VITTEQIGQMVDILTESVRSVLGK
jgi:hypothetical protein